MDAKHAAQTFLDALTSELEEVEARLREHGKLLERRDQLRDMVARTRKFTGEPDGEPEQFEEIDEATSLSVVDRVALALHEIARPATAAELYHWAKRAGWEAPSSGREVVRSALTRRKDVFTKRGAFYGLKQWPASIWEGFGEEEDEAESA